MQVNDVIVIFLVELKEYFINFLFYRKNPVDVRVGLNYGPILNLGQVVYFNITKLLLQTPDNRRGEHYVADGAKPYDEYLLQSINLKGKGRDFFNWSICFSIS